jgi:DNA-binding NtrC family response regulator
MPTMDGMSLLRRQVAQHPHIGWIILTGQASVETAVEGLKLGAAEYLQKPIDAELLAEHIRAAYARHAPARLMKALRDMLSDGTIRHGIVGQSPHVQESYEFIRKAAASDLPVLITGESGTGKELVARAIHEESDRRARPFVAINCAALSDQLLSNELFGHVEGAYTGAAGTKQGLFEVADQGTLFIDEIGDMSMANQAAVLRVIESGEFRRLGDTRERAVDVRIVAATLRNLPDMAVQHAFREDLYYRLNVLPFHLAPLRERREDIPLLMQTFLDRHCRRCGQSKCVSPAALKCLQSHDWPGNIRELANVVERAALMCDGLTIEPSDLQLGMAAGVATAEGMSSRLVDIEREHILRVLEAHGGNKQAAARALGVSRMKLYRKLEQYGSGLD